MAVRRSWKDADGVAATREFLGRPPPRRAAIRDLMTVLLSENPFDSPLRCRSGSPRQRARTGDSGKYADVLIDLVAELPLEQWQARGYVTLAAALNASTHAQRMRLAHLVRCLAEDERNAVRAMALEALASSPLPSRSCARKP